MKYIIFPYLLKYSTFSPHILQKLLFQGTHFEKFCLDLNNYYMENRKVGCRHHWAAGGIPALDILL